MLRLVDSATVGTTIDLSDIVFRPSLTTLPRILPVCLDEGVGVARGVIEPILNLS